MNEPTSEPTPETKPEATAEQKPEMRKVEIRILWYPDPRLVATNQPILKFTPDMESLTKAMFELMYKTDGIGLAAPQIGWNAQLFVMNLTPNDKTGERVYWNPKITNSGDQVLDIEGCLSFPNMSAKIKRYSHTEMKAMTPAGEVTEHFDDLGARAIQHEIDHLEGMLFIDRMTPADQRKHAFNLKQLRYRIAAEMGIIKEIPQRGKPVRKG